MESVSFADSWDGWYLTNQPKTVADICEFLANCCEQKEFDELVKTKPKQIQ